MEPVPHISQSVTDYLCLTDSERQTLEAIWRAAFHKSEEVREAVSIKPTIGVFLTDYGEIAMSAAAKLFIERQSDVNIQLINAPEGYRPASGKIQWGLQVITHDWDLP